MEKHSRRTFLQLSATGLLFSTINTSGIASETQHKAVKKQLPFELAIASYTFRKFSLDEVVAMSKKLNINNLSLKSMHLPLELTDSEIQQQAAKVTQAGIKLYSGGVIYMKNEQEVDNAFRYAKAAGMEMIIGVPDHAFLPYVEGKVKQTGIKVAIHNHGPGDEKYPSPQSIYDKIKTLDNRIGMCMDIGHTQRINLDPSDELKKYFDRILDVHVKDVSASTAEGSTLEIGRGVIDVPKFLKTLVKLNYKGRVGFEYEKDESNPLPGLAESVGYVRGVLATI